MINKVVLLCIVLFGIGCNQQPPLPNLSDEQFVRILADIHMAEIAAKKVAPKKKKVQLDEYYNQVFQIHNIPRKKFEENFALLQKNPKKLTKIYDMTLKYVTAMSKEQ